MDVMLLILHAIYVTKTEDYLENGFSLVKLFITI